MFPAITPPRKGACDQPQMPGDSLGKAVTVKASPPPSRWFWSTRVPEVVPRQDEVGGQQAAPRVDRIRGEGFVDEPGRDRDPVGPRRQRLIEQESRVVDHLADPPPVAGLGPREDRDHRPDTRGRAERLPLAQVDDRAVGGDRRRLPLEVEVIGLGQDDLGGVGRGIVSSSRGPIPTTTFSSIDRSTRCPSAPGTAMSCRSGQSAGPGCRARPGR